MKFITAKNLSINHNIPLSTVYYRIKKGYYLINDKGEVDLESYYAFANTPVIRSGRPRKYK